MKALTITLKQKLTLVLLSALVLPFNSATAKSDLEIMGEVQRARVLERGEDHSQHLKPAEKGQQFRGVYYGYLPCDYCAGIKMTLSLKNKKNYLLVIQYAQASNKEFYEKGKYIWDDITRTVTLVERANKKNKDKSNRIFQIKDDSTLVQLTSEGKRMKGNQKDYSLLRADSMKNRTVHIH